MSAIAAVLLVALGAGEGWFEEPLAIDDAGGRVALVRAADGGGAFELEVRDVEQGGAVLLRAPLGERAPEALFFTRRGVLLVDVDGARLVDARGKIARRFGPSRAVGFARRDGRELVGELRDGEVVVYDLARTQPIARRSFAALELAPPLTWRRGYTEVAGRRAGRYDAAHDRRLPDRELVVDVVSGRVLREVDPAAAAVVARERAARPGAGAFVYAEGPRLVVVSAGDAVTPIDALPLASGAVVAQPPGAGEPLLFSVDDDVYRVEPGGAVVGLARLPAGVVWSASPSRIVFLRRHRAFGRGGTTVEVVDAEPRVLPTGTGPVISPP